MSHTLCDAPCVFPLGVDDILGVDDKTRETCIAKFMNIFVWSVAPFVPALVDPADDVWETGVFPAILVTGP